MTIRCLVLLSCWWFWLGCNATCQDGGGLFSWTLVHTSQIHANIMPLSQGLTCSTAQVNNPQVNCLGSSAKRHTVLQQLRGSTPNPVMVDTGGYFWGTPFYLRFGPAASVPYFVVDNYDIYALEQADFMGGARTLSTFLASLNASTQFVSSNLNVSADPSLGSALNANTGRPLVAPWALITRYAVPIGVISLIDPSLSAISNSGQCCVTSPLVSTSLAIQQLKATHSDVIVVLLSNLLGTDQLTDVIMAHPEISIVVENFNRPASVPSAGDPRDPYPRIVLNSLNEAVPIVSSGAAGQYVGALTVTYSAGQLCRWNGTTVAVDNRFASDPALWALTQAQLTQVDTMADVVIGFTPTVVDGTAAELRVGDWPIARVVTDALASFCYDCDAALIDAGAIRAGLGSGNVTVGDVQALVTADLLLNVFIVSGQALAEALLTGIATPAASSFVQVGGRLRYAYNANPSIDSKLRLIEVQILNNQSVFENVDLDRNYKIVSTNYVANGGGGLFPPDVVTPVDVGPSLLYQLLNHINANSPLNAPPSMANLSLCNNVAAPYFGPQSDCRIVQTVGYASKDIVNPCVTNSAFCMAAVTYFEGLQYHQNSCDVCSGLGACDNRVCNCYGIITGPYAGLDMIGGDDCTTIRTVYDLPYAYKTALYFFASLSIVGSVAWVLFLLRYRSNDVFKSSPLYYDLIASIGTVLTECLAFFFANQTEANCVALIWLIFLGISLLYFSLTIPIYRLYRVHVRKESPALWGQRRTFLLFVAMIVLQIFMVIAIVKTSITSAVILDAKGFISRFCQPENGALFEFLPLFVDGPLVIFLTYVAYKVKEANLTFFHESKPVLIAMFNFLLVIVVLFGTGTVYVGQTDIIFPIQGFLLTYFVVSTQCTLYYFKFNAIRGKHSFNVSAMQIAPDSVTLGAVIGEGMSSVVHSGVWRGTEVAIKVPKNQDSANQVKQFRHELDIFEHLGVHPRVVSFFGSWNEVPHLMLVMELLPNNSVEQLLFANPQPFMWGAGLSERRKLENLRVVIQMLVDSSSALQQLHEQHVIHGDVSARNFLVDVTHRVAITDFGLSRVIPAAAGTDEVVLPDGVMLPIAWCAPETLQSMIISPKTDVYAFGVYLYEVMARSEPYFGIPLNEVVSTVLRQVDPLRPLPPASTPIEVAALMRDCCQALPARRPPISTVNRRLANFLANVKDAESFDEIFSPYGVECYISETSGVEALGVGSGNSMIGSGNSMIDGDGVGGGGGSGGSGGSGGPEGVPSTITISSARRPRQSDFQRLNDQKRYYAHRLSVQRPRNQSEHLYARVSLPRLQAGEVEMKLFTPD